MSEPESVMTVGEVRALIEEYLRMAEEMRKALEGLDDSARLPDLRPGILDPRILPPRGNPKCFVRAT